MWDAVRETFEDHFKREEFQFEIVHGERAIETECSAVLKIPGGPSEQMIQIHLDQEFNVNYFRIMSAVVDVKKCSREQLIRILELNMSWSHTSVAVAQKKILLTSMVKVQEFEADHATLAETIRKLAQRAKQLETLLFGSKRRGIDH